MRWFNIFFGAFFTLVIFLNPGYAGAQEECPDGSKDCAAIQQAILSGQVSLAQLQQWLQSGQVSPAQLQQWLQSGQIRPAKAEQGYQASQASPAQVQQWLQAGQMSPDRMQQQFQSGQINSAQLQQWFQAGQVSLARLQLWLQSGQISPGLVQEWLHSGQVTTSRIPGQFQAGQISTTQLQQMLQSGQINQAQVQQLLQSGQISQAQLQQLLQSGQITPTQLQQMLQSGQVNQAQLPPQLQSGQITPTQIQQLLQSGQISPEQAQTLAGRIGLGTITPAEIEAGKKMLETQKAEGLVPEEQYFQKPYEQIKEQQLQAQEQEQLQFSSLQNFFVRVFGRQLPELDLFGHDLFSSAPYTFAPLEKIPVTNDYIVGPGDVIEVLMWGRMDASYSLEVDSEGVINFPQLGPLVVAGLSYGEVKDLIKREAEAITGVNVSVSMGRLRTIQVFVLGEVKQPGLQSVSSLSTAVNALLSSGGPTELGSLRNVQLKRSGETIVTLDLYDLLLQGDITRDSRLKPGDVIFVPQVGPLVAITGNVKRPAVYEMKGSRNLRTALDLAGGLAPRAYNQRLQIQRAAANQLEVIVDIPAEKVSEYENVALQDGDLIKIFSIIPEVENAVYLYGNVLRPGEYAFREGLRLRDIIPDVASLAQDTYFDYGVIKRYHLEDMSTELIPFDLGKLMSGDGEKQNILLMPLDEIYVFNKRQMEDEPIATIMGDVRNPGIYGLSEKMRVSDLIFKAGNFTRDASMEKGHLFRTDPRTREVTILTFNVAEAMAGSPEQNPLLQDRDQVMIHSIWDRVEKYTVSIKGMVNNPGTFPYAGNMTVRDLILVGGNVKEGAYLGQGEVVRWRIVDGEKVESVILPFNVEKALVGDPQENLDLAPWDSVHIKRIQDWGETRQVTLAGEVLFPGVYTIRKDERLSSVIERAGGFTSLAYFRGAKFTRESVRVLQQQRLDEMIARLGREIAQTTTAEIAGALSAEAVANEQKVQKAQQSLLGQIKAHKVEGRIVVRITPGPDFVDSTYDIILEDGDHLNVPPKPDTVAVSGEVYNATVLIFEPDNPTVKYYLGLTGGPTDNAEDKQMYIVRADGTVVSKAQGNSATLWGGSFANNKLYPGDTLVVPPKLVHNKFRRELKAWTSIVYDIAVSTGIVLNNAFTN